MLLAFVVSSVLQLQRELNDSRIAERGVVLSKGARGGIKTLGAKARRGKRRVGHIEVWMVEELEELGPKFEFHGFAYRDGLRHIELPLLLARTASLNGISAQVAEECTEMGPVPGPPMVKESDPGPPKMLSPETVVPVGFTVVAPRTPEL
jgi:hypothetical protein